MTQSGETVGDTYPHQPFEKLPSGETVLKRGSIQSVIPQLKRRNNSIHSRASNFLSLVREGGEANQDVRSAQRQRTALKCILTKQHGWLLSTLSGALQ